MYIHPEGPVATSVACINSQNEITRARSKRAGAEITKLCSYIYAAEHRLLTLIRDFDEQRGWSWLGFHSCAHWLNFNCGIGMNAAREKIRVAHALGKLPGIDRHFAIGELSYSKVRAMTRIADERNEDYLLMIAKHGTAHHVEKLVSKYRRAKHLRDAERANEQHNNRQLNYFYDTDGCLVIKGRFPAEQGALIVKALEMAMEKDFVGAPHGRDSSRLNPLPQENEEPKPVATRRADAMAEVAETYMNSRPVPNSTADRYQVIVHVNSNASAGAPHGRDVRAAAAAMDVTAETSCIDGGPHVTAETSRRIACDSSITTIREGELGEPLSIGRKARSIPPAIRRALRIRDQGCRFPGCTNDRFVDGHHIEHWADGGETSLNNLVLLCRRHHHLVHQGAFSCEKTIAGELIFKDQQSQHLPQWPERQAIDEEDIVEWLDSNFFERDIDSETCTAKWYAGERMDCNLAVGNLFDHR